MGTSISGLGRSWAHEAAGWDIHAASYDNKGNGKASGRVILFRLGPWLLRQSHVGHHVTFSSLKLDYEMSRMLALACILKWKGPSHGFLRGIPWFSAYGQA